MFNPSDSYSLSTAWDTAGRLKELRAHTNLTPFDVAAILYLQGFRTSPQSVVAIEEGGAAGQSLMGALERLYTNAATTEEDRRRHVA
jgi:hypothetical protein